MSVQEYTERQNEKSTVRVSKFIISSTPFIKKILLNFPFEFHSQLWWCDEDTKNVIICFSSETQAKGIPWEDFNVLTFYLYSYFLLDFPV